MMYIPGAVLVAIANVFLSTSSEYHDAAFYLYFMSSIVVSYTSSSINLVLQFYGFFIDIFIHIKTYTDDI